MDGTRDASDTDFAGYLTGQISDQPKRRIPDIRCRPDSTGFPAGYPVPVTVLRRHFWKFYELLWLAGYPAIFSIRYPASQRKSIRLDTGTGYETGRIIRPDIRPAVYPVHP
jgi:hypothetical protein